MTNVGVLVRLKTSEAYLNEAKMQPKGIGNSTTLKDEIHELKTAIKSELGFIPSRIMFGIKKSKTGFNIADIGIECEKKIYDFDDEGDDFSELMHKGKKSAHRKTNIQDKPQSYIA